MPAQGDGEMIWRPTAQSFVSLALFLSCLGAAAAIVLGLTDSPELLGVTAGLAFVVGLGITVLVTRPRVAHALAEAERPELSNWPGTVEDRRELRRRGWARARRSVAMAVVVGAFCGFTPVFGVACVGAGVAGSLSAGTIARAILAYESAHDVTIMTPSAHGLRRPRRGRRRMHFGVGTGRL